jgi:sterol desaturase/sphingolipid hydroxylase (fatty acid hydroxylase superfamily)
MATLKDLEKRIKEIEKRNRRVESDKAWETSLTRRALLVAFTYLAVGFYLNAINIPEPWLNAIVPAVAFMLSTLTIPVFKKIWLKHIYKKPENPE